MLLNSTSKFQYTVWKLIFLDRLQDTLSFELGTTRQNLPNLGQLDPPLLSVFHAALNRRDA